MKSTKCSNCGKNIKKYYLHKINCCSRKCFADFRRGYNWNKYVPWNKGKKNVYSKKTIKLMRERKTGNKASVATRKKMSVAHSGSKTNFWKGGINKKSEKLRKCVEYKLWREAVFLRDDWTCQECKIRGTILHAHHIKSFSKYPELRLAIDNGITLCLSCHKKTDSYLSYKQ